MLVAACEGDRSIIKKDAKPSWKEDGLYRVRESSIIPAWATMRWFNFISTLVKLTLMGFPRQSICTESRLLYPGFGEMSSLQKFWCSIGNEQKQKKCSSKGCILLCLQARMNPPLGACTLVSCGMDVGIIGEGGCSWENLPVSGCHPIRE